jgi:hypothetical protein
MASMATGRSTRVSSSRIRIRYGEEGRSDHAVQHGTRGQGFTFEREVTMWCAYAFAASAIVSISSAINALSAVGQLQRCRRSAA